MKGFQISATHPEEGAISSYTEADSAKELVIRTLDEFPPEEDWRDHEAWQTGKGGRDTAQIIQLTPEICKAALA